MDFEPFPPNFSIGSHKFLVYCYRWRYLLALLVVGAAFVSCEEDDDSIPDVGVDGDEDELALDQEVNTTSQHS